MAISFTSSSSSCQSSFHYHLQHSILPHLVVVAKFDGKHPSLACATTGGRVLIHSSHEQSINAPSGGIRYLNINRKITALKAGAIIPGQEHEILFIGTESNVLAYDVEKNADVFYKDVPDGVHSMIFGHLSTTSYPNPLIIVGGHCSIQGFDYEGQEVFWTVAGDTVRALGLLTKAITEGDDGGCRLLVGSDDFAIRLFKNEEVIHEITETDRVSHLVAVGSEGNFAYALQDGTIGVYSGKGQRVWKIKSKHQCTALLAFEGDSTGKGSVIKIFSVWSNGSVVARHHETGEILFKDKLGAGVAGVIASDYRLSGVIDVLVISKEGEVKGYTPNLALEGKAKQKLIDSEESRMIQELQARKAELLLELKYLEDSQAAVGDNHRGGSSTTTTPLSNSTTSKVDIQLVHDDSQGCCSLLLSSRNEANIFNVVIGDSGGGVLLGENVYFSPLEPSPSCIIPLVLTKNLGDLLIQVHLGSRARSTSSLSLSIFQSSVHVPKFAMYMPIEPVTSTATPNGSVSFIVKEQLGRVASWMEACFLDCHAGGGNRPTVEDGPLLYQFLCLRSISRSSPIADSGTGHHHDDRFVIFRAEKKGGNACQIQSTTETQQQIQCDDLEIAGELIQDLAKSLSVQELESTACFPEDGLKQVLLQVDDHQSQRLRMTADMATISQRLKTLIVKAEDARTLGEMAVMRSLYAELFKINNELVAEYNKRSHNHQALLEALKEVNQSIQKAANLRMGIARSKVISACRLAIKNNQHQSLLEIMTNGCK